MTNRKPEISAARAIVAVMLAGAAVAVVLFGSQSAFPHSQRADALATKADINEVNARLSTIIDMINAINSRQQGIAPMHQKITDDVIKHMDELMKAVRHP